MAFIHGKGLFESFTPLGTFFETRKQEVASLKGTQPSFEEKKQKENNQGF